MQNYFNEFTDNIVMYIYKAFPEKDLDHAYSLEEYLRPQANIGLNIAVGGKKEKEDIFTAKRYTSNAMKRSASGNIFTGIKNLLKTFDKSLATFAEGSLQKSEIQKENNKKQLGEWKKQYTARVDRQIADHIKHRKENALTLEEQKAVNEWRNIN